MHSNGSNSTGKGNVSTMRNPEFQELRTLTRSFKMETFAVLGPSVHQDHSLTASSRSRIFLGQPHIKMAWWYDPDPYEIIIFGQL